MNQLLQWIQGLLHKLRPKQQAGGTSTVQVERAGGDVQIDNSQRPVTMVVKQNFYSAQVESRSASNATMTEEQREILSNIRRLPNQGEAVFKFMEREFNTSMVIDVRPSEIKRVQAYVTTINQRLTSKSAVGSGCRESA